MEVVLTSEQMRVCDRFAIGSLNIPGVVLMENAGRGVAEEIIRRFGPLKDKRAFVFCGKGNNGGDGSVIARHLFNEGMEVLALFPKGMKRSNDEMGMNLKILQSIAKKEGPGSRLRIETIESRVHERSGREPDIIVDALLGTGAGGPPRPPYVEAIVWMNSRSVPVISVDIPSGVEATSGAVEGLAVNATVTVTMAAKKTGLLTGAGRDRAGVVSVADIGAPPAILSACDPDTFLLEPSDIAAVMPGRSRTAHKYTFDKILVLAGSVGYTGAAAMVCSAAMHSGAGAVMLGVPDCVYEILAKKLHEVIVRPLPSVGAKALGLAAIHEIEKMLEWAGLLVIGPGLSIHPESQECILSILKKNTLPVVIDADALTALSRDRSLGILKRNRNSILTPHSGELSRMTGIPVAEIESNRVEIARSFARSKKVYLLLKGAPSIVASPEGNVFLNPTGNPGMATAGSGDMLTGIIAGLWSQRMPALDAACSGMYLHGLAGDHAREAYGEKSMIASDILRHLSSSIQTIESQSFQK